MILKGTRLVVSYTDGGEGDFLLTSPSAHVNAYLAERLESPEPAQWLRFSTPARDLWLNTASLAAFDVSEVVLADVTDTAERTSQSHPVIKSSKTAKKRGS